MLQDYPPDLDPDSLMGDSDEFQHKLKCGRERSGTGDARCIKTHRRSASHSTAPTVPSTEDEVDPHSSSRSTGGFSRGRAVGNYHNWGDADDVMDPTDWDAPTRGKVMLFANRESGSPPYMSFTQMLLLSFQLS